MKTILAILFITFSNSIFCQNKIYWADRYDYSISRSNLDGSEREYVIEPQLGVQIENIVLDFENGKMYWSEWVNIRRSNLDGTNSETLVTGLTRANGLDLDLENGKIYWTELGTQKIQRSNLDGSEIEDLLNSEQPISIALDVTNNKMYWTDWQVDNHKIVRANLDGTDQEVVLDSGMVERPMGIDLDLINGKIYWTDHDLGTISSSNLDGTNIQELVDGLDHGIDISLNLQEGKMYWIQRNNAKIVRSNLDGSQIEEVITDNLNIPSGIDLLIDPNTVANEEVEKIKLETNPNPNDGNFTVESGKMMRRISFYGVDGKILFEEQGSFYKLNVNMSTYPKGIYYLKIDFENEISVSKKIIIQ